MYPQARKSLIPPLPSPWAVVGIPVYVYIPKFYTDVVGINITVLGYLLLGVRVFDAITDPAIGYFSDRTRTRFGRRRPYIAAGSLILALSIYFLFNPPYASPQLEDRLVQCGDFCSFFVLDRSGGAL